MDPAKSSGGPRVTVDEDEFGGMRIIIRVPRNWSPAVFLLAWSIGSLFVLGWVIGEASVLWGLARGGLFKPEVWSLLAWLVTWTIGGAPVAIAFGWLLLGREEVILDETRMEVRREIGPLARSRSFDLTQVGHLRYSPLPFDPQRVKPGELLRAFGIGGTIAFDHIDRPTSEWTTHRFGDNLSWDEVSQLILTIRRKYKIPEGPALEPHPVEE